VFRIAAAGKVRVFGPAGENSVGPNMHIFATIFFVENLAVARHQNRYRIRQEKHSGSDCPCEAIGARMTHACVLQIDGVHQMMERYVGVAPSQAREQGCQQSKKGIDRIAAESAKKQVEPYYVGLQLVQSLKNMVNACRIVERPATQH
jgi:hypothetical protein